MNAFLSKLQVTLTQHLINAAFFVALLLFLIYNILIKIKHKNSKWGS